VAYNLEKRWDMIGEPSTKKLIKNSVGTGTTGTEKNI
jgi:hypothetical protein